MVSKKEWSVDRKVMVSRRKVMVLEKLWSSYKKLWSPKSYGFYRKVMVPKKVMVS
jgi:hypothetical protein